MKHRRIEGFYVWAEGFFRLLFVVLLFFSILRIIDLLPQAEAKPAFTPSVPATTEDPQASKALPLYPIPVSPCEVKLLVESKSIDLRGQEPKILIYHTHTTEAYTATKESPYVQTSSYRTADPSKSVLAVGEALAQRLRTQYGFSVIHDTTDHEPPSLKTAYDRSEQTMRMYFEKYPSLVLFIDVHRDASSDTKDYVMVDGSPTARIMCVVGQGAKYADKPDFDTNYALASVLTEKLRHIDKRLSRDVRVKTGRYNQHVGRLNLLIEVGHNANTLEQALNAVPFLAECLALTLAEMDTSAGSIDDAMSFVRMLIPNGVGIDKE